MNLEEDLKTRWVPSHDQTVAAESLLGTYWEEVFTVQILVDKEYGFWTEDVVVECPLAVFSDRDLASTFAAGYTKAMRKATAKPVSASWCRHWMAPGDVPMWAVFEDILAAAAKA